MVVELIKQGKCDLSVREFAFDLVEVGYRKLIFETSFEKTIYPDFFREPDNFVIKQPEMRTILTGLKGFKFLVSNYHYELLDFFMEATLGSKWEDLFQLICTQAWCPLFQLANNPFYEFERSQENCCGKKLETLDAFVTSKRKVFINGNARMVSLLARMKLGK
jgi:hypothetical protein